MPDDASNGSDTRNTGTDSIFYLKKQRTTIELSEFDEIPVPDIQSITIDGIDVCRYFSESLSNDVPNQSVTVRPITYIVNMTPINNQLMKKSPTTTTRTPQYQYPYTQKQTVRPTTLKTTTKTTTIRPTTSIHPATSSSTCTSVDPESIIADIFTPQKKTSVCGKMIISSKISFGEDTEEGDWPWHVAIFHFNNSTILEYNCGGSLIKENVVLTAAHCMLRGRDIIKPNDIVVKLGIYNLDLNSQRTQVIGVDEAIFHDCYNPEIYDNDIGLLVLSQSARINEYVGMVCLPSPSFTMTNRFGEIVGWGKNEIGIQQKLLKRASLAYVDYQTCVMSRRSHFANLLSGSNFCAGNGNSKFHFRDIIFDLTYFISFKDINVCVGDSGGGLVFLENGRWVVGGIASVGAGKGSGSEKLCDAKVHTIFTEVSKYYEWILNNWN